jgi:hypothetical protein
MPSTLRVANAGGYWGDDPTALARRVRGETTAPFLDKRPPRWTT